MQPGILLLEDGAFWKGNLHGPQGSVYGEAVFNTAMSGYEEVLTDPSYTRQTVVFTSSHIGNTGITVADHESTRVHPAAIVVRALTLVPSSWRSQAPLGAFLSERGVPILEGVDTRGVTKHLRERGAMRCAVMVLDVERRDGELMGWLAPRLATLREQPGMDGAALAPLVSRTEVERFEGSGPRIVAYDFGIKQGIVTELCERGFEVLVVPAGTPASEALAMNPAGILLSNGPGDPAATPEIVDEVRRLVESEIPLMGICLGHQLLGLAMGAKTHKLKFGHRGINHPVMDLATRQVEITSHNHGFAVTEEGLPECLEVTHRDLYDGCLEGYRHKTLPVFSVQYHPESRPGPRDSSYLFERFRELISSARKRPVEVAS